MADQHGEIDGRDRSTSGKVRRSFADMRVVNQVTCQETARGDYGNDHARYVGPPGAAPDQVPTAADE